MCKYVLNKIKNFNIRNIYQKKLKILANSVDMKNIDR